MKFRKWKVAIMTKIGEKIKLLREEKGWTKTYVAKHLGLKPQTYSNYEYGIREPDLELVKNMASLYQVSTDYLLDNNKGVKTKDPIDLNEALDSVMSFDGKPLNDHDKKVMLKIWEAYYQSKDEE